MQNKFPHGFVYVTFFYVKTRNEEKSSLINENY